MASTVRVRFAPSPTGPLHIGGVRTALFNYLFAKKHGGTCILRIEDTDQNRYVPGAEDYIMNALEWCGIAFDESPKAEGNFGPYRQSERKALYRECIEQLLASGNAYYAFDTSEKLDFHRKDHEKKGKTFIYNWHNRSKLDNSLSMDTNTLNERLNSGEPYVVRFLSPENRTLQLTDIIRGTIEIDSNTLDDKVLFKSDGMPTYHLANIVDDHLMEISHVIRGEEWLPSLALHQLLYDAFGWDAPQFAHLPLIMKPVGKGKLSKRDGEKGGFPVFPLSWNDTTGYREAGYFPEAVVNFLALLGWNPGTEQELFGMDDLIEAFDLDRVNRSGARFDPDKTKWYNHQYLQQRSTESLVEDFLPILNEHEVPAELLGSDRVATIVDMVKERATFVSDFWGLSHFFFKRPETFDAKAVKKQWKTDTPDIMNRLLDVLKETDAFSSDTVEGIVKAWIKDNDFSFGQVLAPLRLVIVGAMQGPHVFDILAIIGKKETLARIDRAITTL